MALYGLFDPLRLYAYIPLRGSSAGVLQKTLDKGDIMPISVVNLRGIPFPEAMGGYPLIAQIVADGL